jgi:hypothetical protein
VRVVNRVHSHPAHSGSSSEVARTTGVSSLFFKVSQIRIASEGSKTSQRNFFNTP